MPGMEGQALRWRRLPRRPARALLHGKPPPYGEEKAAQPHPRSQVRSHTHHDGAPSPRPQEPAGDRFDEEPAECADSPVEIISSEVERLGFPAASSCSEMLSIGACDHDLVKHHLCAKTCGGCDVESDGQAASRRRLGKCSQ